MTEGQFGPKKGMMMVFASDEHAAWVREIVRKEMDRVLGKSAPLGKEGYQWREAVGGAVLERTKPKTDLERAAEIADRYAWTGDKDWSENPYSRGYFSSADAIRREIRALKPSPDWEAQATRWRKIAEGLARSLRMSRAIISVSEERWDATTGANLAAYDAAVKETSLAEGARSKEADK